MAVEAVVVVAVAGVVIGAVFLFKALSDRILKKNKHTLLDESMYMYMVCLSRNKHTLLDRACVWPVSDETNMHY